MQEQTFNEWLILRDKMILHYSLKKKKNVNAKPLTSLWTKG